MKGFDFVRGSLKVLGVVEYRVVVDAYPFDLVLKLTRPLTALDHLLDLPFWLLVIDYGQRGLLMLPWQWVPWVLPKEAWREDVVLHITIREFEAV